MLHPFVRSFVRSFVQTKSSDVAEASATNGRTANGSSNVERCQQPLWLPTSPPATTATVTTDDSNDGRRIVAAACSYIPTVWVTVDGLVARPTQERTNVLCCHLPECRQQRRLSRADVCVGKGSTPLDTSPNLAQLFKW